MDDIADGKKLELSPQLVDIFIGFLLWFGCWLLQVGCNTCTMLTNNWKYRTPNLSVQFSSLLYLRRHWHWRLEPKVYSIQRGHMPVMDSQWKRVNKDHHSVVIWGQMEVTRWEMVTLFLQISVDTELNLQVLHHTASYCSRDHSTDSAKVSS